MTSKYWGIFVFNNAAFKLSKGFAFYVEKYILICPFEGISFEGLLC